jgi:hypothetical protein
MLRKICCSLVVLAFGAGIFAAADSKLGFKPDNTYPAVILKVDQAKHTVVIQCNYPAGKTANFTVAIPATVKLGDIKSGIKYTFFEKGGKVLAFRPIGTPKPPIAKTPPKTVKSVIPPTPQLKAAEATAIKACQAQVAAAKVVKAKTAAAQAAATKVRAAQQAVFQTAKAQVAATWFFQTKDVAAKMTVFHAYTAKAEAVRAEAVAKVAVAQAALAKAEATRAEAAANLAMAKAALAKVDATQAGQAKAMAAGFMKTTAAALKVAKAQLAQVQAVAVKAYQEYRAAQQFEKQKETAAKQAMTRVNQIKAAEKAKGAPIKPKKVATTPIPR